MEHKRKRIDWKKKNQDQNKITNINPDLSVWQIVNKCKHQYQKPEEIDLDSDILTDKQKIKANTLKYQYDSITDAFRKEYGVDIQNDSPVINNIQRDTRVGQIVPLKIISISKEDVVFDNINYKELFVTKNNLWKYRKFREYLPIGDIDCLVVEKDKKKTTVDIFTPIIYNWVQSICKDPVSQNKIEDIETIKVKNLHLVKGGFIGDAIIPNVSDWVGEEFTLPAFIPGSQLTLNVTNNFEEWEGKDVDTFVTSFDPAARGSQLVCSRKSYIRHLGNLEMMNLFNMWCDNDERWDEFSSTTQKGIVTGVINSSRKCGVFVEYKDMNITGMINVNPDQLTSYPIDMEIEFKFAGFEEELEYDETIDQHQHKLPFEIENGVLKQVNVKPVFELF